MRATRKTRWLIVSLAVTATLAVAAVFAVPRFVDEVRRTTCISQLKMIGIAMNQYCSDYGAFPPAFTTDASGHRMHSWRALILPYIDDTLARQYDYTQAWNAGANQKLASRMPSVLRCPRSGDSDAITTYFIPVGPEYMFDAHGCRIPPMANGGALEPEMDKVMIYEYAGSRMNWLRPFDDEVAPERIVLSSLNDGHSVTVAHPDASVSLLVPGLTAGQVHDAFTVRSK